MSAILFPMTWHPGFQVVLDSICDGVVDAGGGDAGETVDLGHRLTKCRQVRRVRHNHDRYSFALTLVQRLVLDYRGDADLMFAEDCRYLTNDAGPIFDGDPQIKSAANAFGGA